MKVKYVKNAEGLVTTVTTHNTPFGKNVLTSFGETVADFNAKIAAKITIVEVRLSENISETENMTEELTKLKELLKQFKEDVKQ